MGAAASMASLQDSCTEQEREQSQEQNTQRAQKQSMEKTMTRAGPKAAYANNSVVEWQITILEGMQKASWHIIYFFSFGVESKNVTKVMFTCPFSILASFIVHDDVCVQKNLNEDPPMLELFESDIKDDWNRLPAYVSMYEKFDKQIYLNLWFVCKIMTSLDTALEIVPVVKPTRYPPFFFMDVSECEPRIWCIVANRTSMYPNVNPCVLCEPRSWCIRCENQV